MNSLKINRPSVSFYKYVWLKKNFLGRGELEVVMTESKRQGPSQLFRRLIQAIWHKILTPQLEEEKKRTLPRKI